MSRGFNTIRALMLVFAGVVAGITLSCSTDMMNEVNAGTSAPAKIKTNPALIEMSNALADVADGVNPSVVNISTTKTIRQTMQNPLLDDPFFRRFFGDQMGPRQREYLQRSLGSGVIVSSDGYILTNNHVVEGADEISVKLHDKNEYKGKIIGTDPRSDVAVIKIEAEGLPSINWGNSDELRAGEMVMAVGSPFGLTKTVTVGIVSATGRANMGITDYEDFIQIDAAINPGNSGGALVNMKGELVGINTAIFSRSGGYQGIGFAVPSTMARQVMDSLIETGEVVRGWLGVSVQELTPQLAKQFGIKEVMGALVAEVVKDSPAEEAGLKQGDVIIEFDGKPVEDAAHMKNMVAGKLSGSKAAIKVIRDDSEVELTVKIGTLTAEMGGKDAAAAAAEKTVLSGLSVQEITAEIKNKFNLAEGTGVMVSGVEPGSLAEQAGVKQGDVIVLLNRVKVQNIAAFNTLVGKLGEDEPVLLLISRQGSALWISVGP